MLSTIVLLRGSRGGRAGMPVGMIVALTHGGDRDSGVVVTQQYFLVECSYVSEKVWAPYDIMMVP